MMASRPINGYARTTYDGFTVNRRTAAILTVAAEKLGYKDGLTLAQGSYNAGGVGASAGTHDGGGAVDLSPVDFDRKVRVLRDLGGAAWHRLALPGVWGEHIHVIFAGDKEMSPAAHDQVIDYAAGRDGLADNLPDTFPYHPDLVAFNYPEWEQARRKRVRSIKALSETIKALSVKRRALARQIARKRKQRDALKGSH